MGFFGYFEKYYIDRVFGWNYIVSMIVLTIQISLVMNSYKWNLKGILLKVLDSAITFGVYIFVFCFAEYFLGSHQYINYICWPFVIAFHFLYFCHYQFFDKVSKGVCLAIVLYLEPMLTSSLIELVDPYSAYFGVYSTVLETCFGVFCVLFMKKFTLKKSEKVNYVCLLLLLFLIAFTLAFIIADLPEGEVFLNAWSHVLIYSLIGVFAFISYYYFYRLNVDFSASLESQALLLKEENARKALETSEANLENLRKRRHDMKNQYQYMRLLLEQGDKEKLNEFFQRMIEGSSVSLNVPSSKQDEASWFEDRICKSFSNVDFLFHNNFEEGDNSFLIETEDLILSLIGENLEGSEKNEVWMEGGKETILLTLSSLSEDSPRSFTKGALNVTSKLQKTKKGTFLTYKITKTAV